MNLVMHLTQYPDGVAPFFLHFLQRMSMLMVMTNGSFIYFVMKASMM